MNISLIEPKQKNLQEIISSKYILLNEMIEILFLYNKESLYDKINDFINQDGKKTNIFIINNMNEKLNANMLEDIVDFLKGNVRSINFVSNVSGLNINNRIANNIDLFTVNVEEANVFNKIKLMNIGKCNIYKALDYDDCIYNLIKFVDYYKNEANYIYIVEDKDKPLSSISDVNKLNKVIEGIKLLISNKKVIFLSCDIINELDLLDKQKKEIRKIC